ncbi:C-type lectin domain family 4 member D-like [Opisthocomus hoazin]|uniref:C-type lectin domain family 4 member D-like n=1 Tax=Opisthocomus hoazin TaxID=30419 RepID=UPI003F530956
MMIPGESPSQGTAAPAEKRRCALLSPWVLLVSATVLKAILLSVCLVAPLSRGGEQPAALQQKFTEWLCVSAVPQGKGQGWTCCPKGWKRFQKSCYYLSADLMPLAESEQNCTGMGSHLAVITSEAEQTFLTRQLPQPRAGANYYIGLRAQEVGQWQWVDGTPFNETAAFWRRGEPSNLTDEMCVVIHMVSTMYNWNDVPCKEHYRICEATAVTV